MMSREIYMEILKTITETIRIWKNRNVLKEYLGSKERETAERMIKDGEISIEKISRYVPTLSMEELEEIEAKVMQLA